MEKIKLPEPKHDGSMSLEATFQNRRSIRSYKNEPITLEQISQLCWAGQGITSPDGFRTAPSAGALFPLELYVVCGNASDLSAGVYKYDYKTHELIKVCDGDKREELRSVCLDQDCIKEGAVTFVITGIYPRITKKYGDNGIMYAHFEVGHVGENIALQAVALGLGTVMVGAFVKEKVQKLLNIPEEEEILYLIPTGSP